MPRLVKTSAGATARRAFFHLVDAGTGITAETGESGGQPQISVCGASWTNTGIGVLVKIGSGRYYATVGTTAISVPGRVIETRYKSAATAETPGDSFQVIAIDLDDINRAGMSALPAVAAGRTNGLPLLSSTLRVGGTIPAGIYFTGSSAATRFSGISSAVALKATATGLSSKVAGLSAALSGKATAAGLSAGISALKVYGDANWPTADLSGLSSGISTSRITLAGILTDATTGMTNQHAHLTGISSRLTGISARTVLAATTAGVSARLSGISSTLATLATQAGMSAGFSAVQVDLAGLSVAVQTGFSTVKGTGFSAGAALKGLADSVAAITPSSSGFSAGDRTTLAGLSAGISIIKGTGFSTGSDLQSIRAALAGVSAGISANRVIVTNILTSATTGMTHIHSHITGISSRLTGISGHVEASATAAGMSAAAAGLSGLIAAGVSAIKGTGFSAGSSLHGLADSIVGLGGLVGTGAFSLVVTVYEDDGATPMPDAAVWITSDLAGSVATYGTLTTNASGVATFNVSAGTHYLWVRKSGWNFITTGTSKVVAANATQSISALSAATVSGNTLRKSSGALCDAIEAVTGATTASHALTLLNEAYTEYCHPLHPADPDLAPYTWSWMQPETTLALLDGTGDYTLPTDFSGMVSPPVYAYAAGTGLPELHEVTVDEIYRRRRESNTEDDPEVWALQSSGIVTNGQTTDILFDPTPDTNRTLNYRYVRAPAPLTDDTSNYPLGPASDSLLLLEMALKRWELKFGNKPGVHSQEANRLLIGAMHRDGAVFSSNDATYNMTDVEDDE